MPKGTIATMYALSFICPKDDVERIVQALDAIEASSVSVEDADADTDAERALFGEPGMPASENAWARSRLSALFTDASAAHEAHQLLQAQEFFARVESAEVSEVPDLDWVRITQAQFEPVPITAHFWIVPSWHDVPPGARHVIRLDPGLAFGTGTHPTTRMCLQWLAENPPEQTAARTVLDYGCGSGILAIGAALLGAQRVDAIDIDPAAVRSTIDNAQANGVSIPSILRVGLPDDAMFANGARYDIVLANILATPLKVLAPLLCARVAPGGALVLAGILERQAEELQAAYAPHLGANKSLEVLKTQDGWVLMAARF